MLLGHLRVSRRALKRCVIREALLQREVVRDAKQPAPKILAGTTQVKVPKQGQEYLLNHLFRIVDGQTHR